MLNLTFFHSTGATAAETEHLRLISSGSKSHTAVPSEVLPILSVAPEMKSIASTSEVLPALP